MVKWSLCVGIQDLAILYMGDRYQFSVMTACPPLLLPLQHYHALLAMRMTSFGPPSTTWYLRPFIKPSSTYPVTSHISKAIKHKLQCN